MIVPRRVTKCLGEQENTQEETNLPLESLRERAAWILLGEPGAGKSNAFEVEAQNTDGICISIAEFLSDNPDPTWGTKTLYLDGLDETRASGGDSSVLLRVKAKLKMLGKPRFRIACRAADWFGSTDSQSIADVSQDKQLGIYVLEPLTINDIENILYENHGIPNPEVFIENARLRGIDGLLDNPQTLNLLAEAIRDGRWPTTRLETFQLACHKLAEEDSKQHRLVHANSIPVEKILATAGQICAVLLLSDTSGIALDKEASNLQFPPLEKFSLSELAIAKLTTSRKLFRPATKAEERVVPSHRSIAEFLAAQWLAESIQNQGLPLERVLNLFLGLDKRTVSGLRGLYGWLAWHSPMLRQRLIEADPLTVIIYGDVKPMHVEEKRMLLKGLCREAETHIYFRWESSSGNQFSALADEALAEDFTRILGTAKRDDANQSMATCVLDILGEAEVIPSLGPIIKGIVVDKSWWPHVRRRALQVWINYSPQEHELIAIIDELCFDHGIKVNHDLVGILLAELYPKLITCETLLNYLHSPKDRSYEIGAYRMFWGYTLPKEAPEHHLPLLLDQLAKRTDLAASDEMDFSFDWHRMLGALLRRGLQSYGDNIDDERLYTWLGVGADKDGEFGREKEDQNAVASWLADRPSRYRGVLELCYRYSESSENFRYALLNNEFRLHSAIPPSDIGVWHLEQASQKTHSGAAEQHLSQAVFSIIWGRGNAGLTLEIVEAWGRENPERSHWLDSILMSEIPEWRLNRAARTNETKLQRAEFKASRTRKLMEQLETIKSGNGSSDVMFELAGVWLDHYSDTHGDTVQTRFDSYCDNGSAVLQAAEAGFFNCPERHDLPNVESIVDLSTKQRQHYIRQPCLVGMDLRWIADESLIYRLSEDKLRCMLAFRLTYGIGNEPLWFSHLVEKRPALVAEVFIVYASAAIKAKQEFIYGLYPLAHDDTYKAVAELAVLPLLECFPHQTTVSRLSHLESLLKAALRYIPEQLKELLKKKLALKTMDVEQRVYWLAVGMLIDNAQYEPNLMDFVGNSLARASRLSVFLSDSSGGASNEYDLSAITLGRLIELITPHAELEHRAGSVTDQMRNGEHVHAMVTRLGALASEEAANEIKRLKSVKGLEAIKYGLDNAGQQLRLKQREDTFSYASIENVVKVLANQSPTSVADLTTLALQFLDDIAYDIRHENDDGFRAFWNVERSKPPSKREENLCRDVLLNRLRQRFNMTSFGVDCQPEGDYANDKRADIRLSYRNEFELPIEIKREDNQTLWTAAQAQLVGQYASAPKAAGYGIYLVLWFGLGKLAATPNGGIKPTTPEELLKLLNAQLDPNEHQRIFISVMDVSWP